MFQTFSIIAIFCSLYTLSVQSFSVVHSWNVPVETSNTQGAPYVTKFGDDKVVFAYFQQKINSEPLKLIVQTFNLSSGELTSKCQIDDFFNPAPLNFSLYNLKINEHKKSSIVLSYVAYDQQKEPNLNVHIINIVNCSSHVQKIDFGPSGNEESSEFPYSIFPYQEEIEVYLSSPSFCKGEFCRLSLNGSSNPTKKPFETAAPKGFWELVPVNSKNLSEGYYFLTKNVTASQNPKLTVTKLNSNGAFEKSIETSIPFEEKKSYSNAYGNLGVCSQETIGNALNCLLLDSSLTEKSAVKNLVSRYSILTTYTVLNSKNDGMLLINTYYSIDYVFPIRNEFKVTEISEVRADGKLGKSFELFKSEFEPFINKHYQGFVNEKDDTYCTAITHVKNIDADKPYYEASVDFKCLRIQ